MPKKESTLVNGLLFSLYSSVAVAEQILSVAFISPYEWRRRVLHGGSYSSYRNTVYQLKKRGAIKVITKEGKKFLQLTKKGEMEVLLAKAKLPANEKWDGKWRLIIFDIPEAAKHLRNKFRDLLKKNNFRKLQASVYISPYPLNREAVKYLEEASLMDYIRIIKAEEMDNNSQLKKKFGLS